MKSNKYSIVLEYIERIEVVKGVWEDKITDKKVKAEKVQIYQRRLNEAMLEGLVITSRFRVRSEYINKNLKYIKFSDDKYKINSIHDNVKNHYSDIEIGEVV